MIDNDRTELDSRFAVRTADDAITFKRTIDAPIERVWELLSTSEGLARWIGPSTIEPRTGGAITLQLTEDVQMRGEILAFEPPRRLVLSWHECASDPSGEAPSADYDSELSFELESVAGGTILTLEHRHIRAGDDMAGFGAGWHAFLAALESALYGTPDESDYMALFTEYQRRF